MGRDIAIDTPSGGIGAWRADPDGAPLGALVVVQEIFGVNAHVRGVVDGYAAVGYVAVAPAFFDPVERGVELGYDEAGFARGRELVAALGIERAVGIVEATARMLRDEGLKVGVVGFCWGGTIAFLSATRLGLPAACYYGARDVPFLDEPLQAPAIFHFGERDRSISPEDVALHREKLPQADIFTYAAGHAFNRDVDPNAYDADSAQLARRRTLDFFARSLE